jgi:hypothetical protein
MKLRFNYLAFLLLLCAFAYGQEPGYLFKRELQGVTDPWHRLSIPNQLFGKLNPDLSDLRLIGLREQGDTVTVPYLLRVLEEERQQLEVPFNRLNESRQGSRYFFTLEVPEPAAINSIRLNFQENNFDRRLMLEGSHDQQEWFGIIDDYRILSIHNADTDYTFTTLRFPESNYRYYRVSFRAESAPVLQTARLISEEVKPGSYRTYAIKESSSRKDRKEKITVLDIKLPYQVPVSFMQLAVKDTVEYYRPITIQYLSDSSHSPKGWKYFYTTAFSGVLSSLEPARFRFPHIMARQFRILIYNQDNEPLVLGEVRVQGSVHELVGRFPEAQTYFLLYGNPEARPPRYDLGNFTDKIPADVNPLVLGGEEVLAQDMLAKSKPLFQDERWLWAIMGLLILLLGAFSLKMIKKA